MKLHHETLARLEHAFMKKRRAHLRGLSEANRVAGTSQRQQQAAHAYEKAQNVSVMYGGGEHDRRSSLRDLLKAAQREGSIQRHEARRQHRDILAAANHRRSQEHDRSRDSIHGSQQDNHSVEDRSRASPVRLETLPSSPPKIKPNGHM